MVELVRVAEAWRFEHGKADDGVVLVYDGAAYGWKDCLRDPQHERPGAMAIDAAGSAWFADGGNDYDGAERWLPIADVHGV